MDSEDEDCWLTAVESLHDKENEEQNDEESLVPLQLLREDETGALTLHVEQLEQILQQDELQGRRLVVISVVGAFRKGKSYLLNVMLNYLRSKGSEDFLLKSLTNGFRWRSGSQRETTGVLFWPEIFLVGENLAVLLLDTQGLFDDKSSSKRNSIIFTFATMLSSVQIYNLSPQIQYDDIMQLEVLLELGRLLVDESILTPFQTLVFLVRDWAHITDHSLGFVGGKQYLDSRWIKLTSSQSNEKRMGQNLQTYFSDIRCCLLNHPGDIIAEGKNFKSVKEDANEVFADCLKEMITNLFKAETLPTVKVLREEITPTQFSNFVRTVFDKIENEMLSAPALFECLKSFNIQVIMERAITTYHSEMSIACKDVVRDIKCAHKEAFESAIAVFKSCKLFGGNLSEEEISNELKKKLENQFQLFETINTKCKEEHRNGLYKTNETNWRQSALEQQQKLYELLGDRLYDRISYNDKDQILERKVAYALFGPPTTYEGIGYENKKMEVIEGICKMIKTHSKVLSGEDNIYFACLIICYSKLDFTEANQVIVFRIGKKGLKNECIFIDTNNRVYYNWNDFINTNQLPECWMCYPENGIYEAGKTNVVKVKYETSQASSLTYKFAYYLKKVATVFGLASSGIIGGVATLSIPVAGPILLGAAITAVSSSAVTCGGSIALLIDRRLHGQSIKLNNLEAIIAWANIGVTPVVIMSSMKTIIQTTNLAKFLPITGNNSSMIDDFVDLVSRLGSKTVFILLEIAEILKNRGDTNLTFIAFEKLRASLLFHLHIYLKQITNMDDLVHKLVDALAGHVKLSECAAPAVLLLIKCTTSDSVVQALRKRGSLNALLAHL